MNIEVCHHCKNTIQRDDRDAIITNTGRIFCRKCIDEEIEFQKVVQKEREKKNEYI
jgi:hypothetical protein